MSAIMLIIWHTYVYGGMLLDAVVKLLAAVTFA